MGEKYNPDASRLMQTGYGKYRVDHLVITQRCSGSNLVPAQRQLHDDIGVNAMSQKVA